MQEKNKKTSGWLDFKAIKQNISFLTILEYYGLRDSFTQKGQNVFGPCPLHNGENPTAFRISLEKNIWHCFTKCKSQPGRKDGGNIIEFVALMENFGVNPQGIKKAAEFMVEHFAHGDFLSVPHPDTPTPQDKKKLEEPEENKPLSFTLQLDPNHLYFTERGLDEKTVEYFGLGLAGKGMMKDRICVPIHDHNGNLVAYVGRAIEDAMVEKEGKYKNPPGFLKSLVLYNFHRVEKGGNLILVEGYFDCFKLFQAGFKNVCALMGSSLSDFQEKLIVENFTSAVLMFDNDTAGIECRNDVLNRLFEKVCVRSVHLDKEKYQPDMLDGEEIKAKLSFL